MAMSPNFQRVFKIVLQWMIYKTKDALDWSSKYKRLKPKYDETEGISTDACLKNFQHHHVKKY